MTSFNDDATYRPLFAGGFLPVRARTRVEATWRSTVCRCIDTPPNALFLNAFPCTPRLKRQSASTSKSGFRLTLSRQKLCASTLPRQNIFQRRARRNMHSHFARTAFHASREYPLPIEAFRPPTAVSSSKSPPTTRWQADRLYLTANHIGWLDFRHSRRTERSVQKTGAGEEPE